MHGTRLNIGGRGFHNVIGTPQAVVILRQDEEIGDPSARLALYRRLSTHRQVNERYGLSSTADFDNGGLPLPGFTTGNDMVKVCAGKVIAVVAHSRKTPHALICQLNLLMLRAATNAASLRHDFGLQRFIAFLLEESLIPRFMVRIGDQSAPAEHLIRLHKRPSPRAGRAGGMCKRTSPQYSLIPSNSKKIRNGPHEKAPPASQRAVPQKSTTIAHFL